jgi:hypothetical protein
VFQPGNSGNLEKKIHGSDHQTLKTAGKCVFPARSPPKTCLELGFRVFRWFVLLLSQESLETWKKSMEASTRLEKLLENTFSSPKICFELSY